MPRDKKGRVLVHSNSETVYFVFFDEMISLIKRGVSLFLFRKNPHTDRAIVDPIEISNKQIGNVTILQIPLLDMQKDMSFKVDAYIKKIKQEYAL